MPIYPGDRNRRIGRKNENDNPVRKWCICSSIITLIFGFFMTLGNHSGFRHVSGETGTTLNLFHSFIYFTQLKKFFYKYYKY